MTQILSCLTRDYVLQVSDRRLTSQYGNGPLKLCEDDQTKAIVVNSTLIFAYAGWGKIEGQNTNEWFAKVLKPFIDSDQFREGTFEVARRATACFARPRYSAIPLEEKRHTFIGIGWQRRRSGGRIVPVALRITNAFDDQFQPLPRARHDFVVHKIELQHLTGIKVLETGGYVKEARLRTLERCLAKYLRRPYYLRTPQHSAKVLAKELRRISDDRDARAARADKGTVGEVGKNLIVTCLPKVAALSWSMPMLGSPDGKAVSTFYVPGEGNRQITKSATIVQKAFPILLSDIEFNIPPPADESDPYAGWR